MQNPRRFLCRSVFALWLLALFALSRPAQAQAVLNPGGSVTGTLDATHTTLTYSFQVTADSDAAFTLTTGANLSAYLYFYDVDGTTQIGSYSYSGGGSSSSVTIPHLGPGATYFLHVVLNSGGDTFTLSSAVTPCATPNDMEPNDDYQHAHAFAFNTTTTGRLGYSRSAYNTVDSSDWYTVTVPKDGDATYTLTTDPTLSAYLEVYDVDGTSRLGYSYSGGSSSSSVTIPHLAPGTTYYIHALLNSGYGGYTLKNTEALPTITTPATLNNTPATALPLAVNGSATGHLGYSFGSYSNVNTEVWYSYVAPQDGDATFTLTTDATLPLSAYVEFYDSNETSRISYAYSGASSTSSITIPHLAPGATYYVHALFNSGYGGYTLSAAYAPQTVPNDKELDDDYKHANAYAFGSTITGRLGYSRTSYSDVDPADWYTVTIPQNSDATFTLTTDPNLSAYVEFYDVDGSSQISYAYSGAGSTSSVTIPHLAPGATYYVQIARNGGYGSYKLSSYLTPVVTPHQSGSRNDTGDCRSLRARQQRHRRTRLFA